MIGIIETLEKLLNRTIFVRPKSPKVQCRQKALAIGAMVTNVAHVYVSFLLINLSYMIRFLFFQFNLSNTPKQPLG